MTHLEVWETEKAMAADGPWERWVRLAEHFAGHSLDGDQLADGYSLDYAYEAFRSGMTAREYAAQIDGGGGRA
ncbi:MAG TPA: hypothetical protein VMV18_07175 [bacterium]|nr:hypothetical protein [bacterium]